MRLSHLFLVLATALSFSHPAVSVEKTRNLSGPRVHDEFTWPIVGHWKSENKNCKKFCEFVITPDTSHAAKMTLINDNSYKGPLYANYDHDLIWRVEYKMDKVGLYLEFEDKKLYDEYGGVWRRIR